MCIKMDNQQLNFLNREQLQVFLSGRLGDGCITTSNTNSTYYITNCKFEEYIDFKAELLGDKFKKKSITEKNGFCQTHIYNMRSCSLDILKSIKAMPIQEVVNYLDDLGIALWFYDDGSLHKTKLFYNLNTQKFSEKENKDIIVPYLHKYWGITAIPTKEVKKNGREYWYLRIGKYDGAFKLSEILNKYFVKCYSYKIISSETIQKWSKLQEELKSRNKTIKDYTNRELSLMLKNIVL